MSKAVRSPTLSKKPLKKSRKLHPSKLVKKKPYLEMVTAILSIPVLITLFILNVSTLTGINLKPAPTPEPFKNGGEFVAAPIGPDRDITPSDNMPCKKALGPVSITSPSENDTVKDNPVNINISYDDSVYCQAAWSYRINGGSWSGYDDRSVALYNLPAGQVTFELRVKSIVTDEQKNLTRKFNYDGRGTVLVPDNSSSGSAN